MPRIVHAKFRPRPDIWLTISGWIWLTYATALLVLFTVGAA
jgi:hypothetical protein